ncbi:thiopeptide-type bacteriocin biosynthesis protein [Sinosporangium siamense]|uniref:Thiopeptide-type bacteriocin biosynthesis domain-containing protein n=1 Tax=Sinosporangium siamense TaxID=1367973 RepID=A0A919VAE8_9ACTN|nr:thiopeptide-type bacteriocin biosynthesis protein [Sinosporangium siamense]GII96363.1 hypothetical protein Ssi02_65940 [Sinosporangium siamense]
MKASDHQPWLQIDVDFADPSTAEHNTIVYLVPALRSAEESGLISSWFFIRKRQWRFRYLPATSDSISGSMNLLHSAADDLVAADCATRWLDKVYEPEKYAFGGTAGMIIAHKLFHADSRHIFTFLDPYVGHAQVAGARRRELSILLCAALMRAAEQDWFEQGDIWASIADDLRPVEIPAPAEKWEDFKSSVRRLITVDTAPSTVLRKSGLCFAHDWLSAFESAGRALKGVCDDGLLVERGIRAVIAHNIIFHWNRLGLPYQAQAAIASAAKDVIFNDA